ncbi:MAG: hypothetical protein KKF56_04620 [Nanoarchaeota archaeon]|nr:hypothetical protein [Nanoarchaeota archaeon]
MTDKVLGLHRNFDRAARKQFPYCISPVEGRTGDYRIHLNGATQFFPSEEKIVDFLVDTLGDNGNRIRLPYSSNRVRFEGKYGMVLTRAGVDIWPNTQTRHTLQHTSILRRLRTGVLDKLGGEVVSDPATATMLFRFLSQEKGRYNLKDPALIARFFYFLKDEKED